MNIDLFIQIVFLAQQLYGYAPLNKMPRWYASSWGYHRDDSQFFAHLHQSYEYSPLFNIGDVIGCFFSVRDGLIFYKNRVSLGSPDVYWDGEVTHYSWTVATEVIPGPQSNNLWGKLYPVVSIQSYGASVRVNFGNEPFRATSLPSDLYSTAELFAGQTAGENQMAGWNAWVDPFVYLINTAAQRKKLYWSSNWYPAGRKWSIVCSRMWLIA